MEWISIKDRLPKSDEYVLTYYIDKIWDETGVRTDTIREDVNAFMSAYQMKQEVTHWMPLPEPPKEE